MLVKRVRPVTPRWDANLPDFDPRREVLQSFGTQGGGARGGMGAEIFPRMNITHDDDNLYLLAEMPGIDLDQLSVSAVRNSVSLAGKRRLVAAEGWQEPGDCAFDCAFDCTVALPTDVDAERMDARYCNGVLALTLPKAPSRAEQRPSPVGLAPPQAPESARIGNYERFPPLEHRGVTDARKAVHLRQFD